MIISCPRCNKQYRLDSSRLNYTRLPDGSGHGVQLACSNCKEQWWEVKKESVNSNYNDPRFSASDRNYQNLTDLSMLYNRQSSAPMSAPSYHSFHQPAEMHLQHEKIDINPLQTDINKKQAPKPASAISVKRIVLWSVILFGMIVTGALIAMNFNGKPIISVPSPKTAPTAPQPEVLTPGELKIDNVVFHVSPLDGDNERIIVAGTTKNSGPIDVPLNNLNFSAYGTCVEGQTPNEDGLCLVREWTHKFNRDLLQPNEELPFKSATKIPANLQIDQVHVDVVSN